MGLFDLFKKKKALTFDEIDSRDKAEKECKRGNIEKMLLFSSRFGGTYDVRNIVYVPLGISRIKEGYDNTVAELVEEGKPVKYNCKAEYKGNSFIPSQIIITSSIDEVEVFKQTIDIW